VTTTTPSPLTLAAVRRQVAARNARDLEAAAALTIRTNPPPDHDAPRLAAERVAARSVWEERVRAAWPRLTSAARRAVWRLAESDGSLSAGRDSGDDVRPSPALALIAAGIAVRWGIGEDGPRSPSTYIAADLGDAP
jgi:hypothetical protein